MTSVAAAISVMRGVGDLNQGGGQQAGNLEQGAGFHRGQEPENNPTLLPPSPAMWDDD